MVNHRLFFAAGLSFILILSGCSLMSSGQAAAPPPPPEAVQPRAIQTNTPTPAPGGRAKPGDILFISNGELMAISADGSNLHSLYSPEQGAVLRNPAPSPDGRYLAFTVSAGRVLLLDLSLGQVTRIEESPADRFDALVWSPAGDAVYYQRLVIGPDSKPARSLVRRAPMPPGSPVEKVLDFDLASNVPILPVAVWRGGLVILHQGETGEGPLGQWLVYDSAAHSLSPLLKDYGLWDVSTDRTQMLLFNTADLASGPESASVPIYSAGLDLAKGAVSLVRLTPDDPQIHLESARFAPNGVWIAALQLIRTDGATRRQAVLLKPKAEGEQYSVTPLAPDDTADDVALAWSANGLVVQRLRGGQSELWLLPFDGSPGALLAQGEQPGVVPFK
jgi:hypothetical protein